MFPTAEISSATPQSRITRSDDEGVAILLLNHPDRSWNVVDEQVLDELRDHVEAIQSEDSTRAVVLASGKVGSFGAGADIRWLPQLAAREDAEAFLRSVHGLMYEIVNSARPFVAAINGPAFGGALELALAGHGIVAAAGARLGLPEITLGLIPGGAGTQLIRRWLPTTEALDLLLSGRSLTADEAKRAGLVDVVVATEEEVLSTAVALARQLAESHSHSRFIESGEVAHHGIAEAASDTLTPAQRALLQVVEAGVRGGHEAGCAAERSAFLSLIESDEAAALIHLFGAEAALKQGGASGHCWTSLAVVGGGQMGSGIATAATIRGLKAVVRDVDHKRLEASREYLAKAVSRLPSADLSAIEGRWTGTTVWEGFAGADAVVEAVFELPELKRETLSQIEHVVAPDALIATNTSAIPVRSLATALGRPDRFLGMHFFSPVERMALVEVVPHEGTSEETLERARSLARRLGQVPVVVADRPGFFTSRVYARWLVEGIRLLVEGADPQVIEQGAKNVGFPVGPLQAHDEATLDLVVKASINQVAERVMVDRIDVATIRDVLERLIAAGVHGRRQGAGFYCYTDGRRSGLNTAVTATLGTEISDSLTSEAAGERLLLAFATECFLCLDDGTLRGPGDGDVASVLGIGFPRRLGGPFHWADRSGLDEIARRAAALGTAFPVGRQLPQLAAKGSSFFPKGV